MKKAHLLLVMSTLLMVGCGKDLNGTYTGSESFQSMGGSTGQNQSSPVTITISGDDDKKVSWVSQFGSGQGTLKGSGSSLTGTMGITDSMYGGGYSQPGGQGQSATNYMMTITISDSDQLTATGVNMGSSGGQSYGGYSMGGGTRSANAKKQN